MDSPLQSVQHEAGIYDPPTYDVAGVKADAYAGYNALFHGDRLPAPLTRALCWSHARRYFFELADIAAQLKKRRKKAAISPLAVEAVRRIDAIFDIERAINGRPAQERHALRQELSAPLVADMEEWMRDNRSKLSKNSDVAEPSQDQYGDVGGARRLRLWLGISRK